MFRGYWEERRVRGKGRGSRVVDESACGGRGGQAGGIRLAWGGRVAGGGLWVWAAARAAARGARPQPPLGAHSGFVFGCCGGGGLRVGEGLEEVKERRVGSGGAGGGVFLPR